MNDPKLQEFREEVVEKLAILGNQYIQVNDEIHRRFDEIVDKIEENNINLIRKIEKNNDILNRKIEATDKIISGGSEPEKGLVVKVDRINQREQKRIKISTGALLAGIGALLTALFTAIFQYHLK